MFDHTSSLSTLYNDIISTGLETKNSDNVFQRKYEEKKIGYKNSAALVIIMYALCIFNTVCDCKMFLFMLIGINQ